ncbi:MAG: PHP domain-containing protein [Myxococcota bacterium]
MSKLYDLHVHSTASDGSLTPRELMREAHACRLAGLALTDHDTVDGIGEAIEEGEALGIEVLAGVEISVSEAGGKREMHVLALGIDPENASLVQRLREAQGDRLRRALGMVERLQALGIGISSGWVREATGSIGRPHVAKALVELGACRTLQEAFERFIGRNGPAYVPRRGISTKEAVQMTHEAGGIAVLAHPPLSVGVDAPGGLERFVARAARAGLDGIEVQHPSLSRKQRRRIARLARVHGLVPTGGSDFHGESKPDVRLGRGRGDIEIGTEAFQAVTERIRERRAPEPR